MYGVGFDMVQIVKVLKLYKIDNDKEQREADEQTNQDRIVIYNEIIDVMKSILFTITQIDQPIQKRKPHIFCGDKDTNTNLESIMYTQEVEG